MKHGMDKEHEHDTHGHVNMVISEIYMYMVVLGYKNFSVQIYKTCLQTIFDQTKKS